MGLPRNLPPSENEPSYVGSWWVGYFSLWVGMIAILLLAFAFMLPLMIATVLTARFFGSEQFEPIMVIWFSWTPVWIWFCFRFFAPAFFDLIKLSGIFLQRLAFVRPSDALAVVKLRAKDMVYDFKLWTVWFRGKN